MVRSVRSIYPTVTYPCHTTMMTGNYPDKHGVTSDHGQMDISRIINPNVMLADYGFLTVDKEGKITDWKAYCLSNGLSAVVYLKNPEDENNSAQSIQPVTLDA